MHRTMDHKVDEAVEHRVIARGEEVRRFDVSGTDARRICCHGSKLPGLAMSRALGDLCAHNLGVCSEPEVHTGLPFPPGSWMIIASDGVWDQTSVAEAASQCMGSSNPGVAARSLVEVSRSRWAQGGNG